MEAWQANREAGKTCPRCIKARAAVQATGMLASEVFDHGTDFCASQSVATHGPGTYGHPKVYVQVRVTDQ